MSSNITLSILIIAGFISYIAIEKYKNYENKLQTKEYTEMFLSKIDTIRVSDFLQFDGNYNIIAKVKRVERDSVELLVYVPNNSDKYDNISRFSSDIFSKFMNTTQLKDIWISKSALKDLHDSENRQTIPQLDNYQVFYLSNIRKFQGPLLSNEYSSIDHETKTVELQIKNNGYDCTFDKRLIELKNGEKIEIEKLSLKHNESMVVKIYLTKAVEEYTGGQYENSQYSIGTFWCIDVVNKQKNEISLKASDSNFFFYNKYE